MKYLILTQADQNGMSEVFHSMIFPNDKVPERFINNWNAVVAASPLKAIDATGKDNMAIYSTWDESTETFTLPENASQDSLINKTRPTYLFVIDNIVRCGFHFSPLFISKFKAAFSAPVTIIGVEDESTIDLGYIYNGSTFFAPGSI
jgi:hypothetical protein